MYLILAISDYPHRSTYLFPQRPPLVSQQRPKTDVTYRSIPHQSLFSLVRATGTRGFVDQIWGAF